MIEPRYVNEFAVNVHWSGNCRRRGDDQGFGLSPADLHPNCGRFAIQMTCLQKLKRIAQCHRRSPCR